MHAARLSRLLESLTADGFLYHGTHSTEKAEAIMADGLVRPGSLKQGRAQLAPVAGRAYYTPSLQYALIYALGGDVAGSSYPEPHWRGDRYGYVFAVPEAELQDPQPDEDSVGEFVAKHAVRSGRDWVYGGPDEPLTKWLWDRVASLMTPRQLAGAAFGEYAYQAAGGKRALKSLSPREKSLLLQRGAHVAAAGTAPPAACWRVDKSRAAEFARDGSNFFEIAETVFDRREPPAAPGG